MPSFLSLPNELILEISDNLLPHDIAALHQTSRRLNSLLENALLTELFRSRSFTHGRRLLYQLSAQPDLKSVEHLIKRGILDFTDPETLLHGAVRFGSVHVLKTLLHFGLEADTKDAKGRTPLSLAAKHGRANFANVLVAREDVDVNSRDAKFMTPLLIAARRGWKVIVEILVQSGKADLQNISDRMGRNCLHLAALRGRVTMIVISLLEKKDLDMSVTDSNGCCTPLSWAAEKGHEGIVKLLLDQKEVNPDSEDNRYITPVLLAASGGYEGIVKLLLDRKEVNPDSKDDSGSTPLLLAASLEGHKGIVKLLQDHINTKLDPYPLFSRTPSPLPGPTTDNTEAPAFPHPQLGAIDVKTTAPAPALTPLPPPPLDSPSNKIKLLPISSPLACPSLAAAVTIIPVAILVAYCLNYSKYLSS
ncbi:ankyrin [Choiromyces venosus 120613-1]|uniref:protein S-acyltransferase n=1 Tax=Choiromyces venosus 120613-1 TaxID=1336337 RepID=A0A3N4JX41_9PEZI|nr:ankyrin [Choiromyces venosus 120613-1]